MSALPALANLVPLRQAGALGPSSSRPGAPPSFFADAHAIRAANGLVRAAGKKEMDDRAKKLMTLKAQLEEEKHEYDKLKLNLEQGEMDAEDAGDIDAIQQEHSKLRSEAESYRKQVEHQRKDVAIAAEKISTLEQRFLEVRERRIEAVRKCHKAKGGVEEVEAEVRVLQKQLTQRGYQKKELQAERFSLQEKLGKETKDIVMSDHVTSTADAQKTRSSGFKESKKDVRVAQKKPKIEPSSSSLGGSDPAVVEMLQSAHQQIKILWDKLHKKQADHEKLLKDTSEVRMKIELDELRDNVGFLRMELEAKGVDVGPDPHPDDISDDPVVASSPLRKSMRASRLAQVAQVDAEVVCGILGGLVQHRRRSTKKKVCRRLHAERARRQKASAVDKNLQRNTNDDGNLTKALCNALRAPDTEKLTSLARFQFAGSVEELEDLERLRVQERTQYADMKNKAQLARTRRTAAHQDLVSKLESKEKKLAAERQELMRQVEISSGSAQALVTTHRFFLDTAEWLRGQVQLGERDAAAVEARIRQGYPMNPGELVTLLQGGVAEKEARLQQIHRGCVNAERDIRRAERLRRKQNPEENFVPVEVRWTGDSDEIDAEGQTTGQNFIFGRALLNATTFLQPPPLAYCNETEVSDLMSEELKPVGVNIDVSLLRDTDILVRVEFKNGLRQDLFFYSALNEFLFLEGRKGGEGAIGIDTTNMDAETAAGLGKKVVDAICIEMCQGSWRLNLNNMSKGRKEKTQSSATLDLECLYNDKGGMETALVLSGMPVSVTMVPCRRIRFGMSFAHVRLYEMMEGWTRWLSLSQRDICKAMGCHSFEEINDIWRNENTPEALTSFLEQAFEDDLAEHNMLCVACELGIETLSLQGCIFDDDKQKLLGAQIDALGIRCVKPKKHRSSTRGSTTPHEMNLTHHHHQMVFGDGPPTNQLYSEEDLAKIKQVEEDAVFLKLDFALGPDGNCGVHLEYDLTPVTYQGDIAPVYSTSKKKRKSRAALRAVEGTGKMRSSVARSSAVSSISISEQFQ